MELPVIKESDVMVVKQHLGFQQRRSICITANSVNMMCVGNAINNIKQKLEPVAGSLTMKVISNR